MTKARSTMHSITKEQFESLANVVCPFCDEDGEIRYSTISVNSYPATIMHNITDNRYIVSIKRGSGAQKARYALGATK